MKPVETDDGFQIAGDEQSAGECAVVAALKQRSTGLRVGLSSLEVQCKPVAETGAYRSALEYVQVLAATTESQPAATDGGLRQSALARLIAEKDSKPMGGDR